MNQQERDDSLSELHTWKDYLISGLQFLFIFYIATFILAFLFIHRGESGWLVMAFTAIIYLSIVIMSLVRMIRKLPMAAIMLAAPTIPLFMLIMVVSLIPILQWLH